MHNKKYQPHIELLMVDPILIPSKTPRYIFIIILTKLHAGYFRISLSLCSQALLWKTLAHPPPVHPHMYRRMLGLIASSPSILLWSLALFTVASTSLLYLLRCFLLPNLVKKEFLHHVGVNYLFAPWISCLLLLQSAPFSTPNNIHYPLLWWAFVVPIIVLDVKIYGQWFIKGKNKCLSIVANPASQLTVIGNLVGAKAAAEMGSKEIAMFLFSLGFLHFMVIFVTLNQRLPGSNSLPGTLRPVFFLIFAAPSMGSLAWNSIRGSFDISSKMLFFLSSFLFFILMSKPTLFKKSMRKFDVAWWAYSFPLTALALASSEYAQEVKGNSAHLLMLLLSALSVIVTLVLMVFTALNTNIQLLTHSTPIPIHIVNSSPHGLVSDIC